MNQLFKKNTLFNLKKKRSHSLVLNVETQVNLDYSPLNLKNFNAYYNKSLESMLLNLGFIYFFLTFAVRGD